MVSTQFHARVKVFQTDNGGEYVNNTLESFFCTQDIIHQMTTPFTPHQNGVSKRKNQQLLEVARSLILDMSVPYHIWGHAVLSAAYLINRTPNWVLEFKTPHDVFSDHVSPVFKLPSKVFRCVTYVHVYFHQRSKLDPCALRCVFIEVPYYVSPSSPIQGEMGSELEILELENDVFEDTTLEKETPGRTEASDWSSIYENETCGLCEETTDHPLKLYRSPIYKDEAGALGVEMTSHIEHKAQTYGVDYLETFASVAKLNTEEIYMDLTPGIPIISKEGVVCKMWKSLYGLKQFPRT
ncbi:unnamed protein product [Prunus armeniaca]